MARFEHPDGRFCELAVQGKVVAVREGTGGKGSLSTTALATSKAARAHQDKLVARLVAQGFASPEVARRQALQAAPNEPLERTIEADLDDAEARLVYADWLTSHGDPRGELISLHHAARGNGPAAGRAKTRASKLIAKHRAMWLGELEARDAHDIRLDWHLGFLERVELRSSAVLDGNIAALAALPSARYVRTLIIGGEQDYRAVVKQLVATRWPRHVERFALGHQRWGEYISDANLTGDVAPLLASYPRLVEADLTLGNSRLGPLSLPGVRRLTLRSPSTQQLDALFAARWPGLERLGLAIGEPRRVRGALRRRITAPALRDLELHVWRDDQIHAIAGELVDGAPLAAGRRLLVVAEAAEARLLRDLAPGHTFEVVKDEAERSG